jgi:peroxiredoxin Q/BCP
LWKILIFSVLFQSYLLLLRLRALLMPLSLHQQAPDFALPSTAGDVFQLSKTFRNKPCILYFYPKDFTPGCTKEACEFRDQFSEFRGLSIDIVGISRDSVSTHLRFKETYRLPFELLADEKGEAASLYQANILFLPLTRRVTYLLDGNHRVAAVYEDMFGAQKHIEAMIEAVKKKR